MTAQENYFETIYTEYTNYKKFMEAEAPKIKEERENFQNYVKENSSKVEDLVEKLFDINQTPTFYKADLQRLGVKLLNTYEAYKDLIEIPEDVQKEIQQMTVQKNFFTIVDGKPKEIDPNYTKNIQKTVREQYNEYIKNILNSTQQEPPKQPDAK